MISLLGMNLSLYMSEKKSPSRLRIWLVMYVVSYSVVFSLRYIYTAYLVMTGSKMLIVVPTNCCPDLLILSTMLRFCTSDSMKSDSDRLK